jgi:hypothetical protein
MKPVAPVRKTSTRKLRCYLESSVGLDSASHKADFTLGWWDRLTNTAAPDMFTSTLVSIISALTALVASVAGPFVTLYVARTQLRANVRSANRQRWIDEFREQVAHFCSEMAIAAQVRDKMVRDGRIVIQGEPEYLNAFGRLIYTTNKIRLMINPLDPEHQELIDLLNGLLAQFRDASADDDLRAQGTALIEQLIPKSVAIIRREWIRVQRLE